MRNITEWVNTYILSRKVIVLIFIFNLIVLLLHLFKAPFVLIDNTTILLMMIVLITPFATHIKKIKWGDFEAELAQDIEKLKKQAKEIDYTKEETINSNEAYSISNELQELAEKDKVLALAKLRIEIEVRLKRLFVFTEREKVLSIRTMTQTLTATGVISNKLRNLILDITSILNRAVHGDNIPTEANIESVLEVGIEILDELDSIFYSKVIEPKSKREITKKELEGYMDSLYEIISVVPLVENPYINKRILNQEQLYLFLQGYDEYAEFLVEIKKL